VALREPIGVRTCCHRCVQVPVYLTSCTIPTHETHTLACHGAAYRVQTQRGVADAAVVVLADLVRVHVVRNLVLVRPVLKQGARSAWKRSKSAEQGCRTMCDDPARSIMQPAM
jgi:hypothetical protein